VFVACGVHIFGHSSDQHTVGWAPSSDVVQGRGASGTWMARTLTRASQGSNCDTNNGGPYNYHEDNGGEIMHYYDMRNSS